MNGKRDLLRGSRRHENVRMSYGHVLVKGRARPNAQRDLDLKSLPSDAGGSRTEKTSRRFRCSHGSGTRPEIPSLFNFFLTYRHAVVGAEEGESRAAQTRDKWSNAVVLGRRGGQKVPEKPPPQSLPATRWKSSLLPPLADKSTKTVGVSKSPRQVGVFPIALEYLVYS